MVLLREPGGTWLALALALALGTGSGMAAPGQDCTGIECPPLENCIEEALEPGECCATCVQRGCACEGYQYYDCLQGGFVRGRVPAGQSYFVDFGSTECSCPPGGGKISCQFMLCPELPPNCIEAVVVADSCPQCGQVGCIHSGRKYAAGHTVHLSPCRACHCPDAGGELICYQLPDCDGDAEAELATATGNFSDAEEGDPERHYEDPYSYDQEVAEAEAAEALAGELQAGTGGPAALGGGRQPPSSIQATPWPVALPRPTAATALGPPAPVQAKARRVTEDRQEREELTHREQPAAGGPRGLGGLPTAGPVGPDLPVQEEGAEARAWPEENLIPDAQATPGSTGQEGAGPVPASSTPSVLSSQAASSPEVPTEPSTHTSLTIPRQEAAQAPPTQEVPKQPPVLPRSQPEDPDPNSVHSVPRGDPEDGGRPQPETTEESALRPESSQVAPNTIALPVPQPNTCKDNGPCKQVCTVIRDTVMCSCFPGYAIMADGVSCEDINECVTDMHTCSRSEHCVNTVGSFRCYKALTCEPGYMLKDGECTDVDECELGTHSCQVGFTCQNTKGSFYCQPRQRCMDGFLQDPEGNCVDINECTSLSEPCQPGFSCVNTVGSYTCQRNPLICGRGYHASQDGTKCVDVNECETGVHHCSETQVCHNLPGSYRCDCKAGFQRDAFGRTCIDVNECWASPSRLCQHTCENTLGSYRCSCASGFVLAADGKHCEDVNECEAQRCSQECANIYGSYQCYCRQGYQLAEDGHTCIDIDECAQGAGVLCTFRCINVPGSYQCACPERGYTMTANGRSCKDLDECALGTHNCSEAETCHNIQGSFRCLRFDCPPNYVRVSETKCERTLCQDFVECQNAPARITHYRLNFQTGLLVPAHIFRISPVPAFAGDTIALTITKGNEEGYFGTRRLNAYTGVVFLQRSVREPRDFALDVEMKLWRQGSVTTFLAKMHIFFTTFAL